MCSIQVLSRLKQKVRLADGGRAQCIKAKAIERGIELPCTFG